MFFYEPIGRLHGLNQMLQAARAAGERVFDILDMTEERSDRRGVLQKPVRGEVVYENVGFSYAQERELPLRRRRRPKARTPNRTPCPARHFAARAARRNDRAGRPHRRRQIHPRQSAARVLRSDRRHKFPSTARTSAASRWIRCANTSASSARRPSSSTAPSAKIFSTAGLNATEEELIAASRAANCHEFITRLAEGLRFPRRRTRREIERRRKTAREHRPRAVEGSRRSSSSTKPPRAWTPPRKN